MDVIEAVKKRKSIRGYKSDPVPKEVLEQILELTSRAPSAMNTQPWEFTVLTGDVLENVKRTNVELLKSGAPSNPEHIVVNWPRESIYRERQVNLAKQLFQLMDTGDVLEDVKRTNVELLKSGAPSNPEHIVVNWPRESIYRERQVDLAKQLFQLMDIPREDKEKRAKWTERGFRYFDAPTVIIVSTDRCLSESGPLLDIGAAIQTICLTGLHFGLGTCIEDQGVAYPEVLRKYAHIPESKRIIMAIAVGYPDWDFPANKLVTEREPIKNITTWLGFD